MINKLFKKNTTLKEKAFIGTFWTSFSKMNGVLVNFLKTIILARILTPNDFGVFGVSMLVVSMIESISQFGIQQSIINKQKETEKYLNSAWTLQFCRGIIISIILIVLSKYAESFFNEEGVGKIIQVLAVSELIKGFNNIGIVYFDKKLKFHKTFIYQTLGNVTDLLVSVFFALILKNAWSIAFGIIAKNIIQFCLSFLMSKYRPKIEFSLKKFKNLSKYGKWVGFSNIFFFIGEQLDDLVIGKIYGGLGVGIYQMSYVFSQIPSTQFSNIINGVAFPIYSKLQKNKERLRNAFFRISENALVISIPIAMIISLFSKEIVTITLGEKWIEVIIPIRIMAIAAMIKTIVATGSGLYYGIGKPILEFKIQFYRSLSLTLVILPFAMKWGIIGASFAVLISSLVTLVLWIKQTKELLNLNFKEILNAINLPIISGFIMYLTIEQLKKYIFLGQNIYINIILTISLMLLSIVVYTSMIIILENYLFKNKRYSLLAINLLKSKIKIN